MGKKYFSFRHDYNKLQQEMFTTIRGASAAAQYKEGDVVDIIHASATPSNGAGRVLFRARVEHIEVKAIKDIPLEVLQDDGVFPGFKIRDHWGFVGLLNSLRRFSKIQSLDEKVCVFGLSRID